MRRRFPHPSSPPSAPRSARSGPPLRSRCKPFVLAVVSLSLALVFGSLPADAHGGGLDGCGGHNDRKRGGYHVHNWARYCSCYPSAAGCAKETPAPPSEPKRPAAPKAAPEPVRAEVREEQVGKVVRVVDGDTLLVSIEGREEKVRLIGVDTPETVDPRKPVQFFGREAAAFLTGLALGKEVSLWNEPGGQDRDKYGRLLRHVFLDDGTLINAEIIKQGYGHAYTRFPFTRMEDFRAYEREAREQGRGLWVDEAKAEAGLARTPTPALAPPETVAPREAKPRAHAQEETVYVTRTGSKYHRAGCRYLSKSMIPMELKQAAAVYAACSVCRPPAPKPEEQN